MAWPGGALPNPRGVCIAFADEWKTGNPTWYRIDDPNGVNVVNGWSIDRGRTDETNRTKVGSATINIIDIDGVLDPTNTHSPARDLCINTIDPMLQIAIAVQHPVTGDWTYAFRGFIDEIALSMDEAENVITGSLQCVDGLAILGGIEVIPDNGSGVTGEGTKYGVPASIPTDSQGDVWYVGQAVDARIEAALADAAWPPGNAVVFSGNVNVMGATYAVRSQILQVILDAADAEFPDVSNVFFDKQGRFVFHGRVAKFDPTGVSGAHPADWPFMHWRVADKANYVTTGATSTHTAAIKKLDWNRGTNYIFNAAIVTPQFITDQQMPAQLFVSPGSIAQYGVHSKSVENLLTAGHVAGGSGPTTPLQECAKFAKYITDNYADPRTRIATVTIGTVRPTHPCYSRTWDVICGVEISDMVTIVTSHPGGGGFNEDYFVEGIRLSASPLKAANVHMMTMELDLSPAAYYPTSPDFP